MKSILVLATALFAGCIDQYDETLDPEFSEVESELGGGNKLSANKLSANKLSANKLSANKLSANSLQVQEIAATADGREVLSYVVGCALATGQTLAVTDPSGAVHTFSGWLNLAPAWATRPPTVSERRWVTACLLSRTNLVGVPVNISMRHDTNPALASTAAERALYTNPEGAFFGDIFAPVPVMYACSARPWAPLQGTFRACALPSNGGGLVTDCGFTYVGACTQSTACTDKVAPFGFCKGGAVAYNEAITIYLTPSQQQGYVQ